MSALDETPLILLSFLLNGIRLPCFQTFTIACVSKKVVTTWSTHSPFHDRSDKDSSGPILTCLAHDADTQEVDCVWNVENENETIRES